MRPQPPYRRINERYCESPAIKSEKNLVRNCMEVPEEGGEEEEEDEEEGEDTEGPTDV